MSGTWPADGSTGWGDTLNADLQTLQNEITQNADAFSNHILDAPAGATAQDPHGDRAYARGLLSPLLAAANTAGGVVLLGSDGSLPGGAWTAMSTPLVPFAVASSRYPPQYRTTLDGEAQIDGYLAASTTATLNGVQVFSAALPSNVCPGAAWDIPVMASTGDTGLLTVAADGTMEFSNLPSLAVSTTIRIQGSWPLDAYHGLVQR